MKANAIGCGAGGSIEDHERCKGAGSGNERILPANSDLRIVGTPARAHVALVDNITARNVAIDAFENGDRTARLRDRTQLEHAILRIVIMQPDEGDFAG